MNTCLYCFSLTDAVCRACGAAICPACQENGLCGVCERLAQYRREQMMLERILAPYHVAVPPALKLPMLDVSIPDADTVPWTAKLTANLAELDYDTLELKEV